MKMSTRIFKAVSLMLAMVLLLAGCAGSGAKGTVGLQPEIGDSVYGDTYPITNAGDKTLTIWTSLKPDPAFLTHEDTPIHQEYTKRTGINAVWQFPTGDATEAFNLLIASGDYPDVIAHTWLGSAYNPADAIREGIIYPLDAIVEAYAPNYYAGVKNNAEREKYIRSEDGSLYGFFGLGERDQDPWIGPMVRADLMEKLNIETPETVDDWTVMLQTFKDNGVATPLTYEGPLMTDSRYAPFIFGGFNTACTYYINDEGKVEFGPMTDKFKSALTLMRDWYANGLLDKEFISIDDTTVGQKMLDGRAAITHYFLSRILAWNTASAETGDNFTYKALPYPTATRGQKAEFGHMPEAYGVAGSSRIATITTQCEDIELAARYLDYGYTVDGTLLCGIGPEGQSWNRVDGEIVFVDEIKADVDKIMPYIRDWCYGHDSKPIGNAFKDLRYTEPAQKEAQELWVTNMNAHVLPTVTPTQEEADELNQLVTNIDDYVNEQVLKFITGGADMESYDDFIAEMKRLGVERVVEIKQNQYDRFNSR